jgi:hemoglobin-like flavoprotein
MVASMGQSELRKHRRYLTKAEQAEVALISLSPEVVKGAREAWQLALAAAGDFATDLYAALFELSPTSANLFPGDLSEQRRRLTATLMQTMDLLEEPEDLVLLLKASGARHLHYGTQYEHFPVLGRALIQTLERRLGHSYTDEHRKAWESVYKNMADVMSGAIALAQLERA